MSASIRLDAAPGPLTTTAGHVTALSNFNNSGVLGWLWELLDAPDGSAAAISSPNSATPTITPDVTGGTYLIRLTTYKDVARTLLDATDRTVIEVNFVDDLVETDPLPAAGETKEADPAKGWKPRVNRVLKGLHTKVGTLVQDPNTFVMQLGYNATAKDLVIPFGSATVNGRTYPIGILADTSLGGFQDILPLAVVIAAVDGGALTSGKLVYCRRVGIVTGVTIAGPPSPGDPIFLSDTGTISATPGAGSRIIGLVMSGAGPFTVYFMGDGLTIPVGFEVNLIGALPGDNVAAKLNYCGKEMARAQTFFTLGVAMSAIGDWGFPVRQPALLNKCSIYVKANSLTTNVTFALLKNGGVVSTITPFTGGVGRHDFGSMPISFVPDDTYDISVTNTAGGTGNAIIYAAVFDFAQVFG